MNTGTKSLWLYEYNMKHRKESSIVNGFEIRCSAVVELKNKSSANRNLR